MAKIGLSGGFSLIPEGTHVFEITRIDYKEEFGKMEVTMQIASGQKHVERFSLLKPNGTQNQGALNAFSYFAKVALNDFTLAEIDPEDLVGHFIRCEVEHEEVESKRTPGEMIKFVRLGDKESADGYDEVPLVKKSTKSGEKSFDLDSILG